MRQVTKPGAVRTLSHPLRATQRFIPDESLASSSHPRSQTDADRLAAAPDIRRHSTSLRPPSTPRRGRHRWADFGGPHVAHMQAIPEANFATTIGASSSKRSTAARHPRRVRRTEASLSGEVSVFVPARHDGSKDRRSSTTYIAPSEHPSIIGLSHDSHSAESRTLGAGDPTSTHLGTQMKSPSAPAEGDRTSVRRMQRSRKSCSAFPLRSRRERRRSFPLRARLRRGLHVRLPLYLAARSPRFIVLIRCSALDLCARPERATSMLPLAAINRATLFGHLRHHRLYFGFRYAIGAAFFACLRGSSLHGKSSRAD